MSVNVQGGDAGSQTTGVNVTLNGNTIGMAESIANQAIIAQTQKAVSILKQIRSEVVKPHPDTTKLGSWFQDLSKTLVADAIKAAVKALIARWLP